MMRTFLFWPFIIWIIHKCLASTLPSNEEMELSSSISLASQNRVKRDFDYGKYKVKCQQSGTGLFSFFAVPILLGDVTLDFMNMISVTVSISASASAPAATVMNTNKNTNMNTNSNRKKRRLRDLDWVLESCKSKDYLYRKSLRGKIYFFVIFSPRESFKCLNN